MIPKIIHYCWFGRGEKPQLIQDCIASWKKYCPDYDIIEWNEDNFDFSSCQYAREAYEAKKWAFVSDYVRLYALYNFGGLYFDTDIEVLKPLDKFLSNDSFTGFESKDSPITAVMGAHKGNEFIKELLDYYLDAHFVNEDGTVNLTTNTTIITEQLVNSGVKANGKFQIINEMAIYPQIVFCPNNLSRVWNKPSSKSFTIHHFDQSWKTDDKQNKNFKYRLRRYLVGKLRNIIGTKKAEEFSKRIKK